jgi:hypothetical protein
MNLGQENLEKMIGKLIKVIKPKEVSNIEFNLKPIDDNEYYMNVTYVVPDDSEYLKSNNMRNSDYVRSLWNKELHNTILNYFNVRVLINSSGIRSKSYNERLKYY